MKKIVLLTAFIFSSLLVNAQNNTIAKFKFEEAEQAFVTKDYQTTIAKLNEAEELLKSTNPKILYLKVVSISKLIESNSNFDFALLNEARILSNTYLKDYENLPDNEDKYRDIYTVSEQLKSYALTEEEFDAQKNQQILARQQKEKKDIEKIKEGEEAFMRFIYFDGYELGLTEDETRKRYPAFKKVYKIQNEKDNTYDYAISVKYGVSSDIDGFYIKNNKTIGYFINSSIVYDDVTFSKGFHKASEIVNTLKLKLNFEPIVQIEDGTYKDYIGKITNYIWNKNNKKITVAEFNLQMQLNSG